MANKKHKSYSKCPEPINTFVDIAGAAVMGAVAKKKLMRDYEKGCGEESAKAALAVFGIGAARRGGAGLVSLGGLHGVKSAMSDIENGKVSSPRQKGFSSTSHSDDFCVNTYTPKDNKYAWRLNCADGTEYGIHPEDYETREEYNNALATASETYSCEINELSFESSESHKSDPNTGSKGLNEFVFCKVSRLDNGSNQYYFSDNLPLMIGDFVYVTSETGTPVEGIVLSIETHTIETAPQAPEQAGTIIGRVNE